MMIPAAKIYDEYGLPRSMLRQLADAGVIKREVRGLDICHQIILYEEEDIKRYLNGGAKGN